MANHLPWANPNKCKDCDGIGVKVRQVQSDRYTCGFITQAYTCGLCLGSGRNMPTYPDNKLAAAGEAR